MGSVGKKCFLGRKEVKVKRDDVEAKVVFVGAGCSFYNVSSCPIPWLVCLSWWFGLCICCSILLLKFFAAFRCGFLISLVVICYFFASFQCEVICTKLSMSESVSLIALPLS